MMDWSDIPFVLAVCETGTLSGAARKLGVNHSTVYRRLDGVEDKLGVTLFERLSHGYVMTPAGEHFLRLGRELHDGVNRIQRELGGQDLRLEGALSVTTTDSLLHWLGPVFMEFQEQYPDIELRLMSDTRSLDLMQRDADIALRPTQHPPEHWIGRSLLPIAYTSYACSDYLKSVRGVPPEEHRWIQLDDSLRQSPMSQITALRMVEGARAITTNSVMGMLDLVRACFGIAVLPCYLEASCPDLVRLEEPEPTFDSELWMLAHPDIRRSAKVHAFFEFATARIKSNGKDQSIV
ncbi:MAG: LysR family transcriptional regulator [Alphaproteobacteria bacterium]|nr:LysR family transcriptional regulator [Alphaproteobacteria bacterium]